MLVARLLRFEERGAGAIWWQAQEVILVRLAAAAVVDVGLATHERALVIKKLSCARSLLRGGRGHSCRSSRTDASRLYHLPLLLFILVYLKILNRFLQFALQFLNLHLEALIDVLSLLVMALRLEKLLLNFLVHGQETLLVILDFGEDVLVALARDEGRLVQEALRVQSLIIWDAARVQVRDSVVLDLVWPRLALDQLLFDFQISYLRVLMLGLQFVDLLVLVLDLFQLDINF